MRKIFNIIGHGVFWFGASLAIPGAVISIFGEWIIESTDD